MRKWELMFVDYRDDRIIRIFFPDPEEVREYKHPENRPEWKSWLRRVGENGWELATEFSLNGDTIHATLKKLVDN